VKFSSTTSFEIYRQSYQDTTIKNNKATQFTSMKCGNIRKGMRESKKGDEGK
jgi:hypothetical protein